MYYNVTHVRSLTTIKFLYHDPLPDSYLLHAFVIENDYQAAASREPKSGSLYK